MWITKAQFLNYLNCPTMMWFDRHSERSTLTSGEELRITEGRELGERARKLFPGGVLVETRDVREAANTTCELLADPSVPAIFEATFIDGSFVTRADILVRNSNQRWILIEVKSSLHNEDDIDPDHLHDLAYTTMVTQNAGLRLDRIELMRISREWRLGHDDNALFRLIDCSDTVKDLAAQFRISSPDVEVVASSEERPEPRLTKVCKDCSYFSTECLGKGVEHPIIEVPRLNDIQLEQLHALGVLDVRKIPAGFRLTENQRRVVENTKSGKVHINRAALASRLDRVVWPCYYLDFETVKSAIPFWKEIAPHAQVLTQFSLHVAEGPDSEPRHFEYLAPQIGESTRELLESLLSILGDQGSIVVYSSFEKTQISALAGGNPDKLGEIQAVVERLFDLEKVFKEAIRHPLFRGRTSIKKTLPALVPDMSYKTLPINNGDAAVAAFVRMAKNLCSGDEIETIRRDLLAYCRQDTLAMVELHRVVINLLNAPEGSLVGDRLIVEA